MTHSHVTWLMHMWHDSFTCDMTHSHVTWLMTQRKRCVPPRGHVIYEVMVHKKDTGESCPRDDCLSSQRRDSFIRVIWRMHTWHDSSTRDMTHATEKAFCASYVPYERVTWHIRDMTHPHLTWLINTWHDSWHRESVLCLTCKQSGDDCVYFGQASCSPDVT